ncbi:MAG TPA: hypothetical protein VF495_11155 [Phenylobacterium sp.]
MPAYTFATITSAQALAYSPATDTISFPSGVTAAGVSVLFAGGQTIVTSGGTTVTFGPAFLGQTGAVFGDGSKLVIGTGGADVLTGSTAPDHIEGGSGDDQLGGGAGADLLVGGLGVDSLDGGGDGDTLRGGFGDDQLRGGRGLDTMEGGDGADAFVFAEGDGAPVAPDIITDWTSDDRLVFGAVGAYQEASAPDAGRTYANSLIAGGARFVAMQTPSGVIVYADTAGNGGVAEDAVLLSGRTLADISAANLDGAASTLPTAPMGPAEAAPTPPVGPDPTPTGVEPTLPARPATPLFATGAEVRGNMDAAQLSSLLGASIEIATPTHLRIEGDLEGDVHVPTLDLVGTGFVYDSHDQLLGGSVTGIIYLDDNFATNLTSSVPISAATFGQWVLTNATQVAFSTILAGNDNLGGFVGGDLIRGYAGNDVLSGLTGNDTIFGGLGNDQIFASGPGGLPPIYNERDSTYLRGDEGDDYIIGASGFDDANGNMGNDTISTRLGDDYCVGGKDSDLLFGDAGADLVYGNLGADTCVGGDGNDIVRGGQDNDVVLGGKGNDFVSGDKGDDTMTGGDGADIFHTFGDAGIDRVVDFRLGDGDRVQLDPGTQFTVTQVGPDTVINMTGGGQMILVGVAMSSLTGNWIFGA